jgi:predicted DNA-binding transcriptional regulator AlpA
MPELRFEIADRSLTVDEFCEAERMSRTQLYKRWKEGRGPRYFLTEATGASLMKRA